MASATEYIQGNVIDGKAVAAQIRHEIKEEVSGLRERYGKVPGLAVVIVGERKDSQTYVRMKKKGCEEVGIKSFSLELPATVTQKQLVREVQRFNRNADVHGILVQLPLPDHIDERAVLEEISIEKDVDGFHPLNIANLAMKGREPLFLPCTPLGCMELLDRCGVVLRGKRAVVLGRSNIVGLPVAMLLNNADATVTIVHSRTKDVEAVVREADVIVAAIGRAEFVKAGWVKPGAVIIDVGINPVDDSSRKSGYRLVGDAEYEGCQQVAGAITPVPGGVGPMTIAMLLRNTLRSGTRAITSSQKRQGLWPAAQDLPSWPAVAAAGVLAGLVLQRVFARSR